MDYQALRTEIQTDPIGLGYAGKSDWEIQVILNRTVGSAERVERTLVDSWEVLAATDPDEWVALSPLEKQRYQTVLSCGTLNIKSSGIRAVLGKMFGAGSATRQSLAALQQRVASRAEALFGQSVSMDDVSLALRGGVVNG